MTIDIQDLLADLYNVPDEAINAINISSTFAVRSRCQKCGTGPTWYFKLFDQKFYADVRKLIDSSKKNLKWVSFNENWYLELPSHFRSFKPSSLEFCMHGKSFAPIANKNRKRLDQSVMVFCCDCSKSQWLFKPPKFDGSILTRNRRGRYSYPNKMDGF